MSEKKEKQWAVIGWSFVKGEDGNYFANGIKNIVWFDSRAEARAYQKAKADRSKMTAYSVQSMTRGPRA